MKPLILTLLLTLMPSVGWAEECNTSCPDKLGFNILGKDGRVTYDQRVCFQNCRIANALEQIAERMG